MHVNPKSYFFSMFDITPHTVYLNIFGVFAYLLQSALAEDPASKSTSCWRLTLTGSPAKRNDETDEIRSVQPLYGRLTQMCFNTYMSEICVAGRHHLGCEVSSPSSTQVTLLP